MDLSYKVTYSKRKTLSIIVDRDRSIIVRAPIGTSSQEIEKVIAENKMWLFEKLRHPQKYPRPSVKKEMVTGENLLYLGRNYQLEISQDNFTGVMFNSKFFVSGYQKEQAADLITSWYIDQARVTLPPRIKVFAENLGVEYKKILVMDLKYSWATCTPKKNLNFNWRIIKAPLDVIDYIIVHELAHLIMHDHSPEFWNIVAVQTPGYQKARQWLKENGYQLEIDFVFNEVG